MITQTAIVSTTSCSNGIQDGDETAIDCGGSCSSCGAAPVPTCDDGTQNQEETGIDCGGLVRCLKQQSYALWGVSMLAVMV